MESGKALIALLVLGGLIVGTNLVVLLIARNVRGAHFDWLNFDNLVRLSKKEDDNLSELNERIRALKPGEKDEN